MVKLEQLAAIGVLVVRSTPAVHAREQKRFRRDRFQAGPDVSLAHGSASVLESESDPRPAARRGSRVAWGRTLMYQYRERFHDLKNTPAELVTHTGLTSMNGVGPDRNLLFGILALQVDFVTRDDLVAAMNAWALAKHKPLGQILVETGALAPLPPPEASCVDEARALKSGSTPTTPFRMFADRAISCPSR